MERGIKDAIAIGIQSTKEDCSGKVGTVCLYNVYVVKAHKVLVSVEMRYVSKNCSLFVDSTIAVQSILLTSSFLTLFIYLR